MIKRANIPQLIAHLPLFRELSASQQEKVLAGVKEVRLDKGALVFTKGDPVQGFHVVAYGQVKLFLPSIQGNEKVVEIIGPQQSFGEAVMFLDRPYPVSAEVLADSLLLHVSRESVLGLLETDASFARRMLAGLSMRLHSLLLDVESYSLRSSTQRVIGYLLQHWPEGAEEGTGKAPLEITLPTSKQVIASRLNLTPETLSRILGELTTRKLIAVQGRAITIPDAARLRDFEI
ncbi:MAG: Crp/Fnr family transcriptional regulator [Rhodocyclaceae bacterium]|nr:MAG: Crp/Fnr family transcriptional regulator [Rhodocyclaceae bacterium]